MKNYLLALKNLLIKKKEANPIEISNVTVDNNEKDDTRNINYEEILILGISAGMTMGLVAGILSSFIGYFKTLVNDCSD